MSLRRRATALLPGWARRGYRRLRPQIAGGRIPASHDIAAAVPFAWLPSATTLPDGGRLAIVCHLFHADQAPVLRAVIDRVPYPADIFVSTDTNEKRAQILAVFAGRTTEVRLAPNRGRDVAPRLVTFADIYHRYDLALFLHGKKSLASSIGAHWRDSLIETLVGSPETVRSIVALFAADPRMGVVMADHIAPIRAMIGWYANFRGSRAVAHRMGIELRPDAALEFPAGSMFWCRTAALRPLLDLGLAAEDFPPEAGQTEATLQHALERLVLHAAEHCGYRWAKVAAPATIDDPARLRRIEGPAALDAFLAESRFALLGAPSSH